MHCYCQLIACPDNRLKIGIKSDQVGQPLFLEHSMHTWSSVNAARHDPELHNVVKCKSTSLERFLKSSVEVWEPYCEDVRRPMEAKSVRG
jgi:hypothetical protein